LILSPVVSQPHYGSPSSFVFSHLPVGLVCRPLPLVVLVVVVLVDHHPLDLVLPCVQRKEEKHGKAGGAGLAELVDFEEVEDRRKGEPSS